MYRVLLVDDHAVVRKGMKAILEDELSGIFVAEAGSGDQALSALAEPFDVVVLDLSMPGRSGIDLLAEIKTRQPKLPVLIMSLHGEEQFAVRALRAGAVACRAIGLQGRGRRDGRAARAPLGSRVRRPAGHRVGEHRE